MPKLQLKIEIEGMKLKERERMSQHDLSHQPAPPRIRSTMKAAAILLSSIPVALCFGPSSIRTSRANVASRVQRPSTDLRASLEAILFDCDGVLADTERDGHRYLIHSFVSDFRSHVFESKMLICVPFSVTTVIIKGFRSTSPFSRMVSMRNGARSVTGNY